MIDTNFLRQLEKFALIINKRITSNYIGERFSKATGRGLIFKDHVMYGPGEDFRSIDWKLFRKNSQLSVTNRQYSVSPVSVGSFLTRAREITSPVSIPLSIL